MMALCNNNYQNASALYLLALGYWQSILVVVVIYNAIERCHAIGLSTFLAPLGPDHIYIPDIFCSI